MRVVNAGMERAIRRISVERGYDPRDYALVAFGGAAGMHACELAAGARHAARARAARIPGLLSAWGAAARRSAARLRADRAPGRSATRLRLAAPLRPLVARARRELRAEGRCAGADPHRGRRSTSATAASRTRSRVPMSPALSRRVPRRAPRALRLRRSSSAPSRSSTCAWSRAAARAVSRAAAETQTASGGERGAPHRLRWNGRWLRARRCDRAALPRGRRVAGPLVITELSATIVVPPAGPCGSCRPAICCWSAAMKRPRSSRRSATHAAPGIAPHVRRSTRSASRSSTIASSAIAEEMGVALCRSAFSPNIKERRDYSCAVFDARRRAGGAGRAHPGASRLDAALGARGDRAPADAGRRRRDPQRSVRRRHASARRHRGGAGVRRRAPASASSPTAPITPTSAA